MYHSTPSLFHQNIIKQIKQTISDHHGDEVFFVAWVDGDGIVSEIEAVAFGNKESVPAPLAEGLKGDLIIHNHPSGDLRASNPDINIAALLATKKLGFYIVNNNCSEVNIVYKPKPRISLSENQILSIFKKDGLLEKCIGNYEERPEQEQLVAKITEAINNNKILLAEAGTGTGKSLAYLIPTALWAVQSDKRVFITTHTINLQNQIAQKDAELVSTIVERITGIRTRFSVLVGRSNYICPKNLYELSIDSDKTLSLFDNPDNIRHQLDLITTWMEKSEAGLKSEIPDKIASELWEEVSAATPNCPRKDCSFYSDCFYYKARMVAESSHILIGNHALLLSAIDDDQGFTSAIPHFSGLVIDEAHNLSLIALEAMAETFSFGSILWRLSRLYRQKGDKTFGQLSLLRDRSALDRYPQISELFHRATHDILHLVQTLKHREENLRHLIQDQYELYTEITPELLNHPLWKEIKSLLTDIFIQIQYIESNLTKISEQTQAQISEEKILEILRIVDIHNTALHEMRKTFEKIFDPENTESATIKQMETTSHAITFSTGPASVGDFLAKHIFRPKEFTIFTSATLAIENNFDFFSDSIGLSFVEKEHIDSISLPSPFDYKNQMHVLVVKEQALTHRKEEQQKLDLVKECILSVRGGALILYTSYKSMNTAYEYLANDFIQNGLHPLKQGDYSREHLINTMREKDYTILFGTSSFWEGIDVQGQHLRLLIIDRLPFDNPSNPLTKAICRLIEEQGKNAFKEYAIPRAVLKYKQGIGRLIRSKKDRGILLVLDGRIFSKFYGTSFVNIAKPSKSLHLTPKDILSNINTFFNH